MKRIGFLCLAKYPVPSVKGGAVETLVTNLLDENEKSHLLDLVVFSFGDKEAESQSEAYKNAEFFFIKKSFVRKALNKVYCKLVKMFNEEDSLYYQSLKRNIKESRVSAIVLEASSGYALKLKRDFPTIKLFFHVHNIPEQEEALPSFVNSIDGSFCISQFIQNETIKRLHVTPQKVSLWYNSVDLHQFCPATIEGRERFRMRQGFDANDKIIIYAGRLQPYKGIKQLLEAFCKINDPNIKLLIVGSSFFSSSKPTPFMRELKILSQAKEDKISFTGFVPHQQIQEFYQIADVAVLPSMWEEPFGLTCLEALACGLPVITTKSGGLPEIVTPKCGILLDRDSRIEDNIYNNILNLLNNQSLLLSMSLEARLRAEKFDSKDYLNNFCNLIKHYEQF